MIISLIAAVGKHGQIGLKGELPWRDEADMEWFSNCTENGLVVVGKRTAPSMGRVHGSRGRFLYVPTRSDTRTSLIALAESVYCKSVWIAGGAMLYDSWMHRVDRVLVSRVNYDGPADAWMPDLSWSPFAVARGT